MTAAALRSLLQEKSVALWVDGDRLKYRAPVGALTPEILSEIVRFKRELVEFLRLAETVMRPNVPAILPTPRDGPPPLSYAQERLWFLQRLDPSSVAYNIPGAVRIMGSLDRGILQRVFTEIVRRHEVLRTCFRVEGGRPVQVIRRCEPVGDEFVDLRALGSGERENRLRELTQQELTKPFDLEQGPLIRILLMRVSAAEHVMVFTMHHIVSDAWSLGVMIREFGELYNAFLKERPSPLPEPAVQYADYGIWQRGWLCGKVLEEQIQYWRQQLHGAPTLLALPFDRPRSARRSVRGAVEQIEIPHRVLAGLRELCRRENVTLFILLSAVFKVLLHRYSGETDIVVGTPVANRNRSEIENSIGFFANTLALRSDLSGTPDFLELLRRERDVVLGASAHQDVPFEHLVQELRVERHPGSNPLFQVVFILQEASREALKIEGLELRPALWERTTTPFDFVFDVREADSGLRGALVYSVDLFERTTAQRLVAHWERLLEGVVSNPRRSLLELESSSALEAEPERDPLQAMEASFDDFARQLQDDNRDSVRTP